MPEDLTPSIEIKDRRGYCVIAYDGIRFDDHLMSPSEAAVVQNFLRHAVSLGWELHVLYKPEG